MHFIELFSRILNILCLGLYFRWSPMNLLKGSYKISVHRIIILIDSVDRQTSTYEVLSVKSLIFSPVFRWEDESFQTKKLDS